MVEQYIIGLILPRIVKEDLCIGVLDTNKICLGALTEEVLVETVEAQHIAT